MAADAAVAAFNVEADALSDDRLPVPDQWMRRNRMPDDPASIKLDDRGLRVLAEERDERARAVDEDVADRAGCEEIDECAGGLLVRGVVDDGSDASPESLRSGIALMEALDCKGETLVVSDGLTEHRVRGTGFLVGRSVLMGVEHMIPQTPGVICGFRARLGGRWDKAGEVTVWSERGETDRRGIDLATVTLTADAPGHVFRFATQSAPVGAKVTLLGHPRGAPLRESQGVVTKEHLDYGKPTLAARFSPDIQGGDSGAPMLNSRGEVVSVLSRIITTANLTSDGSHHWGGIDVPAWWGG